MSDGYEDWHAPLLQGIGSQQSASWSHEPMNGRQQAIFASLFSPQIAGMYVSELLQQSVSTWQSPCMGLQRSSFSSFAFFLRLEVLRPQWKPPPCLMLLAMQRPEQHWSPVVQSLPVPRQASFSWRRLARGVS